MSELFSGQTEIVSSYTRGEAIEDGVLVDMTKEPFGSLAREAGIIWPIAMTNTAFAAFVEVSDAAGHSCQDVKGGGGTSFGCFAKPAERSLRLRLAGSFLSAISTVDCCKRS